MDKIFKYKKARKGKSFFLLDKKGKVFFVLILFLLIVGLVIALNPSRPALNSPLNESTNIELNPVLNVTVTDPDGDVMNVTFWNEIKSITAGFDHSCGLLSNGSAMCWGRNNNGQIGDGSTTQRVNPTFVNSTEPFISIIAGGFHTCGLLINGGVKCWGSNNRGQIGNGSSSDTVNNVNPTLINSTESFVSITADGLRTCSLLSNGSAMCWGLNTNGQVGDGTIGLRKLNPTFVNSTEPFISITAGDLHTCGLLSNGSAMCWGDNENGQIGNGSSSAPVNNVNPTFVNSIESFVSITAGDSHTCGLLNNGSVMCWGSNFYGQIGNGSSSLTVDNLNPTFVNTSKSFVSIIADGLHTCGLLSNESAMCWGYNVHGQIGDGSTINRNNPVFVNPTESFVSITAGSFHTCGVLNNGSSMCWGQNDFGQIGNGSSSASVNNVNPTFVNTTETIRSKSIIIGNNTNVADGSSVNITWASLGENRTYLWRVTTDDGSGIANSHIWKFTTTSSPNVTIIEPEAKSYSYNESLVLNYTITNYSTLDTCWYYIFNSTDDYDISNTTLPNCVNTTFNVSRIGDTYTLYLWVNDTNGLTSNDAVTFTVSTTAVNLNAPLNNTWFDNQTNIYFNYTPSSSTGIDTCQLWGEWSGGWHNNFTWIDPTNATMNSTSLNISDGTYEWNVLCNNTGGIESWATSNYTVNIDTVYPPNITINSITPTAGSQTFSFNSTEQDINIDSCKYSIFDSTGAIDGINENVSYTCGTGQTHSATTTAFATFNLTIYAIDLAGNENSTTKNFTTTAAIAPPLPPGGGGGITIIVGDNETAWGITTTTGTDKYEIFKIRGVSRSWTILFENLGESERTISLSCEDVEGELCRFVTFENDIFSLPVQKGVKIWNSFTLNFPEEISPELEIFNIIATDDLERDGSITVEARKAGVLTGFFFKLLSTKEVFGMKISYIIIFLISMASLGAIGAVTIPKKVEMKIPLVIIFSVILGAFIVILL